MQLLAHPPGDTCEGACLQVMPSSPMKRLTSSAVTNIKVYGKYKEQALEGLLWEFELPCRPLLLRRC